MRAQCRIWLLLALGAGWSPPVTGSEAPAERTVVRIEPSPPPAATRELMRRWHRTTRGRLSPVLREWAGVERATRQRPGQGLAAGCRRLELALGELHRSRLPVAPDPSVSLHLEQTLRALAEAARSCSEGAWFLTNWRLDLAEASWRELRARLRLYDLKP